MSPTHRLDWPISIHAPREGSDCHDPGKEDSQEISIHAPRGGERHLAILHYWLLMDISIHAPRGGSDLPSFIFWTLLFQSTLPVGGATGHGGYFPHRDKNFNPRSPRGERPRCVFLRVENMEFQSTLPAGGATVPGRVHSRSWQFQSTLPAGGATVQSKHAAMTV